MVEAVGDDGEPVVLVGALGHLEERERAHVIGAWVQDSRYGMQVKVSEAQPLPPSDQDADAVIAYLHSVKHVGPSGPPGWSTATGRPRCSTRSTTTPAPPSGPPACGARRDAADSWDGCASPAGCTCCWPPTGWPTSRPASTTRTATARPPSRLRASPTSSRACSASGSDRRPDRSRWPRRPRRPAADARRRPARPVRGRARRQHLPAARAAAPGRERAACGRPPERGGSTAGRCRRPRPRGALDLSNATAELEAELAERVHELSRAPTGDRSTGRARRARARRASQLTAEQLHGARQRRSPTGCR